MKRRATYLAAPLESRGRKAALIVVGTVLACEIAAFLLAWAGAPW